MPCSSIRNGYSLVPWAVPRYLTMRRRRVEIWSVTRWSSKITQSETYSSRPWRVSVPSPRSPVMMAVTPLSLSQRNRRRSSERRMWVLVRPANSVSIVSSTTRLAPTASMAAAEADEQTFQVVFAGLLDLAALDRARGRSRASCRRSARSGRSRASATFSARSVARSSKLMKTPGSPCCWMPRTRNSMPSSVLPQPAPPQTASAARAAGRRR